MTRQSTQILIPPEYIKNDEEGLCRVCGKSVKRPFRKYCSTRCSLEYQKCFKTWTGLRDRILAKQESCEQCESKDKLEVDHKLAIMNSGEMWDENNLQVLCHKCHLRKTRADLYDKKYIKDGQRRLSDNSSFKTELLSMTRG